MPDKPAEPAAVGVTSGVAGRSGGVARSVTVALVLAALLVVGCGEDEENAPATSAEAPAWAQDCEEGVGELSVDPATVDAGETVAIQVKNLSEDRMLTYGLANELERSEGEEWVQVELPATPILEIALVLGPGETSAGGGGATGDRLELPRDLEPDRYRVVKNVTAGDPSGGGPTESLRLCAPLRVEA